MELLECIPSPQQTEYRNKSEFSFGRDLNGNPTIGFQLGLFKDGYNTVLNPGSSLHTHPMAKKIVDCLQEYLQSSDLAIYDRDTKSGFWRLLQIRTQRTGQGT